MMDNNSLLNLSDKIAECSQDIEKTKLIVGDIVDKYSFAPGGPLDEKNRKALSIDADRAMTYLFIVLDYIASTDERLSLMQDMIVFNDKEGQDNE